MGIGAAAVVVLGGLALVWGRKKTEKVPVREEERGEDDNANMDDPLTSIILWYEDNMPRLYQPGMEKDLPIGFASQARLVNDWQPVQQNAGLNINDPGSLDRLMAGTEQMLKVKTANGEWNYLQTLFLLTMLSDAAEAFNEKEFQLNAHIVMKDEYRRMNRVNEMHYMSSMVGRYLCELGFYVEAEQELVEPLKYTQPLVDEKDRTDLRDLVHIRVRSLSYMSEVEFAKKKLANKEYLKQIEAEVVDLIQRYPNEPICQEIAEKLKSGVGRRVLSK
eukprot:Phypoly_transcript_13305.p1 GENE.Phypoly_transcript_13305~~Phypoly_transcript_13305.p1  ORF type:complete len:300 (+),score=55.15 Phypoly_transcript_13305:75-902(+)